MRTGTTMSARRRLALVLAALAVMVAVAAGALTLVTFGADGWLRAIRTVASGAVFAGLGGFLAVRVPRNRLSWLFIVMGLLSGLSELSYVYPATWPGALVLSVLFGSLWAPSIGIGLTFLPLWFPTGTLPSRRWRWVARGAFVGIALFTLASMASVALAPVDVALDPEGDIDPGPILGPLLAAGALLTLGAALCAFGSLAVRFRRSRGDERQQLKWLFGGVVLDLSSLVAGLEGIDLSWLQEIGFYGPPVAIAVAVSRYRLYEIDRIFNRTLVYTVVTGLLAVVYLALVSAVGLLSPGTGESPLAVAAATLAAAALFRPLRTRVQAGVDRRFDRRRYDAVQVVGAYRAHVRERVDLDAVARELVDAASRTMGAVSAGLWLRAGER